MLRRILFVALVTTAAAFGAYWWLTAVPPALALTASAEVVLMVISGGAGTLLGPMVGAALVVIMKNVASAYIARWNFLLGAIFVLIVIFMPEGMVPGSVRLTRWLRRALTGRSIAAAREARS